MRIPCPLLVKTGVSVPNPPHSGELACACSRTVRYPRQGVCSHLPSHMIKEEPLCVGPYRSPEAVGALRSSSGWSTLKCSSTSFVLCDLNERFVCVVMCKHCHFPNRSRSTYSLFTPAAWDTGVRGPEKIREEGQRRCQAGHPRGRCAGIWGEPRRSSCHHSVGRRTN